MLTSDLLKFTTRKGQIYPYQLKAAAEPVCASSVQAFKDCAGLELGEAKERLLDAAAAIGSGSSGSGSGSSGSGSDAAVSPIVAKGLHKLLLDKCSVDEPDENLAERRWAWLTAATALRRERAFDDVAEYHAAISQATGAPPAELTGALFADLPDKRRIQAVPDWPAAQLLDRYNLAQIQGLILRAKALRITAQFADLGQQRAFFRQLKFQRLVAETASLDDGLALKLAVTGPLAVLDSANSYGLRLAQFVPWVLALPKFEVAATVTIKRKSFELLLTPSKYRFAHSPYRLKGHVPEELTLFLEAFAAVAEKKKKERVLKAELATEPVILPGGELICPDFVVRGGTRVGKKAARTELPIELFHKWHKGGLVKRWQFKAENPDFPLLIGASRSLKKKPEIAQLVKNSPLDERHVIWFSSFPSAGKMWENLASWGL